jgi:uncharacterized membrane protein
MEAAVLDWLGLALRWAHIVTGIAWIGTSFYFMWLDSHLEPPDPPRERIEGELWMTHSGGFYRIEKMHLVPSEVPRTLHWFKWEAAWTWITGFALLVVVYYLGSEAYLVDPEVFPLGKSEAVAFGITLLVVAWLVYDGLYRSSLATKGAAVEILGLALLCAATFVVCQLMPGRAAYVHLGAMVGTIMVANVWMIIIPAQRRLVAATRAGTKLDPRLAAAAKQRSVHNNYMTLPVVFIMMSSHYPTTYGHEYNWAILIAAFAVGAVVRHWFNLRNKGTPRLWPIPAAAAGLIAIMVAFDSRILASTVAANAEPVAFAQVSAVINERCVSCHSVRPTDKVFKTAPKNVRFDTSAEIKSQAAKIESLTVLTRTMPPGNATKMKSEERELLRRWFAQGATVDP